MDQNTNESHEENGDTTNRLRKKIAEVYQRDRKIILIMTTILIAVILYTIFVGSAANDCASCKNPQYISFYLSLF